MSESKHTPGHISYLPCFTGDGYNYGGGLIVTFGDVSINLGGVDPQRGTYPNEKLAHLIAAAPDLLSALQALAEDQTTAHWQNAPYDLLRNARAAIARATGATP